LGGPRPEKCRLLTVFVHGFSNDEFKALKRWDDDIWPVIDDLIRRQTCDIMLFFWPSDADIVRVFSAVEYPRRIKTAISAGAELGGYLKYIADQRNPGLRVQFVGHSLGCRVVLSAVQQLARQPQKVSVERILLMGAAVPEGDCTASGPWPEKVSDLFRAPRGRKGAKNSDVILYSLDDEVLGGTFQVGERLARWRGLRSSDSQAVGLTGGPGGIRWTGEAASCGLKHSDYLVKPSALRHVAGMLGPLVDRQMPERPDGQRSLGERQPDNRHLTSRFASWVRRLA
jgi:esterase/lipase superfamily enzyme